MDDKKGIIIDPYCGSGTTLVAAKILNHDFIGIEISDEYIEFAQKRLNNFESELKFAQQEIEKHKVIKTFKDRKLNGEFTGKYGPKKKNESNQSDPEINLFHHLEND
jgi:modification methylase